jgi:DNA-binding protein HU-beta
MKHTKVRRHIRHSKHGKHVVRGHHRAVVTKPALIDAISKKYPDMKKSDIHSVFDTTIEAIGNNLKKGDDVRINGLGIFKVKTRAARPARKGRNPATGAEMMLKAKPASKIIRFRPAKEIKP